MKIIFTKDAPRIGRKYEIKEVPDGYGRHLVATGVAEIATPQTMARLERKNATDVAQKKVHADLLAKNLEDIRGSRVVLKGKANEQGHLFASIHKDEILAALKESTRLDMDPQFLILEKPLKELGEHTLKIVAQREEASFTVVVEEA